MTSEEKRAIVSNAVEWMRSKNRRVSEFDAGCPLFDNDLIHDFKTAFEGIVDEGNQVLTIEKIKSAVKDDGLKIYVAKEYWDPVNGREEHLSPCKGFEVRGNKLIFK